MTQIDINKLKIDPFPDFYEFFETKGEYMLKKLEGCFNLLKKYFSNENDFISFLNNFKGQKDLKHFFRIMDICNLARVNKNSFFKLILYIAAIEKSMSKEKYMNFYDWLISKSDSEDKNNTDFKSLVRQLYTEYNKVHGSHQKLRKFFANYLNSNEKLKLIRSFKFHFEKEKQKKKLPLCWNECKVTRGVCYNRFCKISEDEHKLEKYTNEIAKVIFNMRSDFVHNGRIPIIPEIGVSHGYYKKNNKKILCCNDLKIREFADMILNGIYRYYLKVQKDNSVKVK